MLLLNKFQGWFSNLCVSAHRLFVFFSSQGQTPQAEIWDRVEPRRDETPKLWLRWAARLNLCLQLAALCRWGTDASWSQQAGVTPGWLGVGLLIWKCRVLGALCDITKWPHHLGQWLFSVNLAVKFDSNDRISSSSLHLLPSWLVPPSGHFSDLFKH